MPDQPSPQSSSQTRFRASRETVLDSSPGNFHVLRENGAHTHGADFHVVQENDLTGATAGTVLELRVRNHPGTMSHITGLFARRAFNLEAIVCVPLDHGAESRVLLLVPNEPRLQQVEQQLAKLYDVLAIRHRPDLGAEYFARLGLETPA